MLVAFAFCIVTVWIRDVITSEVLVYSDPRMSFHFVDGAPFLFRHHLRCGAERLWSNLPYRTT